MIRVAIADDSAFTCRLLASYLEGTEGCQVVGIAHDASSTLAMVREVKPDVLTLDLEMPGGHGLELLRTIAQQTAVAVVVVSGVTRRAALTTLRALEYGAVDFVLKYTPGAPVGPASLRREIVAKVRLAAAVPPSARQPAARSAYAVTPREPAPPAARLRGHAPADRAASRGDEVVVIGASTGGPRALREVLAQLPADFATPCVIVQHMPPLFTSVFASQLGRHVRLPVHEAGPDDRLEPGRLLLTPGGHHLLLRPHGRFELRPVEDGTLYRPSIDMTMISAADTFGRDCTGVVLSGMGSDGAEGLKHIRACGGQGYVQEPASCVVAGMPSRALERAGADYVASPALIGSRLARRGHP